MPMKHGFVSRNNCNYRDDNLSSYSEIYTVSSSRYVGLNPI